MNQNKNFLKKNSKKYFFKLSEISNALTDNKIFPVSANQSEILKSEKKKLCKQLENILGNLTDFDIKVSQLRADFMNYTKTFLNHHYSRENKTDKEKYLKEKDIEIVSYSNKMNDLNQLLQKYKLDMYLLKDQKNCNNKVKNILTEVQTNFINLITIMKREINDSGIPISFVMINLYEKINKKSPQPSLSFENNLKEKKL